MADSVERKITVTWNGPLPRAWWGPGADADDRRRRARRLARVGRGSHVRSRRYLRTLPLRSLVEQAVLRRHARAHWLRWDGDGEPRPLRRPGRGLRWARPRVGGRRGVVCVRALLRQRRHDLARHRSKRRSKRCGNRSSTAESLLVRSGRLVLRDKKSGEKLEPALDSSIGVVEDPSKQCSGPLWVRGGIVVESADGEAYEVRNRVTLCRCGAVVEQTVLRRDARAEIGFRDGIAAENATG